MTRDRPYNRSGAPLLALLAFAFLLRIVVPAGWMPAHGTLGIMPCPSAGPVEVPAAHGDGGHHQAHVMHDGGSAHETAPAPADHGEKKGCDFAPLGLAWAEAPVSALEPAPPAVARPIFLAPVRAEVGRGLAAPPPPSTGPPLHA